MVRTTPIYGRKLALARATRHISRRRFGDQVGLTVSGLYKVESREISHVFHDHARQFPAALGISQAEFERDFVAPASDGKTTGGGTLRRQRIGEIPVYELSLSAGPWSDVIDLEGGDLPQQTDGPFRMFISGDSMEPLWRDGEIVEFHPVDLAALEQSEDYCVQRTDGLATFKRLLGISGNSLRFGAINEKKHPAELHVDRGQIRQIGHAVGVFQPRRSG
jgi:hypothetical protein